MSLIFVDCEAVGPSVSTGHLTEFGAVEYATRKTFHGVLCPSRIRSRREEYATNVPGSAVPGSEAFMTDPRTVFMRFGAWLSQFPTPLVFVSDNPAYDWQWINDGFHVHLGHNPMGHSARRIGDWYAGLVGDWRASSKWKKFRRTPHDHHPVRDAQGNVEAFEAILRRYPQAQQRFVNGEV